MPTSGHVFPVLALPEHIAATSYNWITIFYIGSNMSKTMNKTQMVRSNGIYNGLPVLDDRHRDLRAIVVGASGISGQSMIDVLTESPQRWAKVYAMSRRAPQRGRNSNKNIVEHVPTDLLKEPQEIASKLEEHGVQA